MQMSVLRLRGFGEGPTVRRARAQRGAHRAQAAAAGQLGTLGSAPDEPGRQRRRRRRRPRAPGPAASRPRSSGREWPGPRGARVYTGGGALRSPTERRRLLGPSAGPPAGEASGAAARRGREGPRRGAPCPGPAGPTRTRARPALGRAVAPARTWPGTGPPPRAAPGLHFQPAAGESGSAQARRAVGAGGRGGRGPGLRPEPPPRDSLSELPVAPPGPRCRLGGGAGRGPEPAGRPRGAPGARRLRVPLPDLGPPRRGRAGAGPRPPRPAGSPGWRRRALGPRGARRRGRRRPRGAGGRGRRVRGAGQLFLFQDLPRPEAREAGRAGLAPCLELEPRAGVPRPGGARRRRTPS